MTGGDHNEIIKENGCTGPGSPGPQCMYKSSEESETVTGNEVDPAKQSAMDEVDETLAREDNILVEDETEPNPYMSGIR